MEYALKPQLQMVWPVWRLTSVPAIDPPAGYERRTFRPGDEAGFFKVMELAGFDAWDTAKLQPWIDILVPGGWFLVVHQATQEIAATTMASHKPTDLHPGGGQINWVAGHPAHAGRGLGLVVCSAATAHLLQVGYRDIYLQTDDFRLAAIKTYLKLGYEPFLFEPEMEKRWAAICQRLGWPFTPDTWPRVSL